MVHPLDHVSDDTVRRFADNGKIDGCGIESVIEFSLRVALHRAPPRRTFANPWKAIA